MSNSIDANDGGPICNLDYLLVNLGRNRAAANRLVQLFLENHPQLVAWLEQAAMDNDISAMQDVVHDIRGSCVLFSAHRAVALARELEYVLHCHRQDGTGINWLARSAALRNALTDVHDELKRYQEESPVSDLS
ncbi:Hpt domain-containing protein [Azonexus hydrophilus]|uniref:Hpt domain-containing protein n=1 Tax=Azonexus hydrophilus TaxID=418702 RepID=UPI00248F51F7|nr:Hpt domain-containing protein [Azonexus hydrophilus]